MKKILIFCEGVADQVFIADCLHSFYSISLERNEKKKHNIEMKFSKQDLYVEIIDTGGYQNLAQDVYLNMIRKNSEGYNIVVFDADETDENGKKHGSGSFKNTGRRLSDLQNNQEGVYFDFYLWPNNESDGKLEDLIRKLIQADKEAVMECIENHQRCLSSIAIDGLRLADKKQIISFYLYTNNVEETKPRYANYRNEALWNLNPQKNEYLGKFKSFLDEYFPTLQDLD